MYAIRAAVVPQGELYEEEAPEAELSLEVTSS